MRIAVVHSFYSSRLPSGENQMVLAQVDELRRAGHEVLLLGRRTDDLEQVPGYAVRAAARVVTGRGGDPTARLAAFSPDLVHVHNLFPNIGTSWLARWPGPVVGTLHNYRPLCANGLLFRDGATCTLCPDGDPVAALRHACYRGSRVATLPLAVGHRTGAAGDALLRRADAVVVLSETAREVYARYGVPHSRLALVPNFVDEVHGAAVPGPEQERWIGVGRLTPEKGFAELAARWPADRLLDVVGEGPEGDRVAGAGITRLGPLDRDRVRHLLPGYSGLVFPGRCLEGATPLVVVEALEAGVPVLARAGSAAAALVEAGQVGAVWSDAAGPSAAMDAVVREGHPLRVRARRAYKQHFTALAWRLAVDDVYGRAASRARVSRVTATNAQHGA